MVELKNHVFMHKKHLKRLGTIEKQLKGHKLKEMNKLGGIIGDLVSECCGEGCGKCTVCP